MKYRAFTVIILFLAAIAYFSPNASADANSYLKRLEIAGYYGPISAWMNDGWYICNATASGVNNYTIASVIVLDTGPGIYYPEAYEIIDIARDELCPGGFVA